MNIDSHLRELPGPRPLRRGSDIVSKPHIWNHDSVTKFLRNSAIPLDYNDRKGQRSHSTGLTPFDFTGAHDVEVLKY